MNSHSLPGRQKAFSLIELLSVMTLFSVMAVATLPALRGSLDGFNVSGAADLLGADLSLARQTAMTRNLPVEVRFYKHDDGTGEAWRALGVVIPGGVTAVAEDEWITPGRILPGNIVMEEAGEFSTLLTPSTDTGIAPRASQETASAPRVFRGKNYVAFRFQPDGSTDLPSRTTTGPHPWCVTLKNYHSKPVANKPSANFAAFVLDPLTGRAAVYRP